MKVICKIIVKGVIIETVELTLDDDARKAVIQSLNWEDKVKNELTEFNYTEVK